MPNVHVLQDQPRLDLEKATKHGVLSPAIFGPFQQVADEARVRANSTRYLSGAQAYDIAARVAAKANPDDFLLPLGDPLLMMLASLAWVEEFGELRVLKWDRQTQEYIPVVVNFGTLAAEKETGK